MRPFQLPLNGTITRETYKAIIARLDPDDDAAERTIREEIERNFTRELTVALAALLNEIIPVDATETQLRTAAGTVIGNSRVSGTIRKYLGLATDLGVNVAIDQLETVGIGFDYTLAHTDAAEWARRFGGQLVTDIDHTTQRLVSEAVEDFFLDESSLPDLRKRLRRMGFDERRARMIAQTETTRAAHHGSVRAYMRSGVVSEVMWLTANDEKVCPICGPLHGRTTELRSVPTWDGIRQPAHPNCRCGTVAIIDDSDKELLYELHENIARMQNG